MTFHLLVTVVNTRFSPFLSDLTNAVVIRSLKIRFAEGLAAAVIAFQASHLRQKLTEDLLACSTLALAHVKFCSRLNLMQPLWVCIKFK